MIWMKSTYRGQVPEIQEQARNHNFRNYIFNIEEIFETKNHGFVNFWGEWVDFLGGFHHLAPLCFNSSEWTNQTKPLCAFYRIPLGIMMRGVFAWLQPHSSSFSLWCFSSFSSFSFVPSSWFCYHSEMYHYCILLLLVNHHNIRLIILLVWIWKSHRILPWLFSAQMFLYTMPATWLWRSKNALPGCIFNPLCAALS